MDFLLPEYDKLVHHPREPRVKKILALLVPQDEPQIFEEAKQLLEKEWGTPQRISPRIPFVWTNYYEDISPKLDRIFFSYPSLHHFSDFASWKRLTVELEKKTGVTRRVNLDPGKIERSRLVAEQDVCDYMIDYLDSHEVMYDGEYEDPTYLSKHLLDLICDTMDLYGLFTEGETYTDSQLDENNGDFLTKEEYIEDQEEYSKIRSGYYDNRTGNAVAVTKWGGSVDGD